MKDHITMMTGQALRLIEEIETYEFHKHTLLNTLKRLHKDYEGGIFNYHDYERLLAETLKGRSRREWIGHYNSIIFSLLRRIEPIMAQASMLTARDIPPSVLTSEELAARHIISVSELKRESAREGVQSQKARQELKLPEQQTPLPIATAVTERRQTNLPAIMKESQRMPQRIAETAGKPSESIEQGFSGYRMQGSSRQEQAPERKPIIKNHDETLQATAAPEQPDKELDRLVENIRKIDKEAPILSPVKESTTTNYLLIRFKLGLVRLHTLLKERQAKKIAKTQTPEEKAWHRMKEAEESKKIKETMKELSVTEQKEVSPIPMPYTVPKKIERPAVRIAPQEKTRKPTDIPEPKIEPIVERTKELGEFTLRWEWIKRWYAQQVKEQKKFLSPKSSIPHSMQAEGLKHKILEAAEESEPKSARLKEEVLNMRALLEKQKAFKIYEPSYLGVLANVLIRKFTFMLIDMFPTFFKGLYDSLRLANMPILSNTYVNIMILSSAFTALLASVLFGLFFLATDNPLALLVPKTLFMALVLGGIVFMIFTMYPKMKAQSRQTDINTNLPFAINHFSAVSGSGVPPTKMFTLLVESGEYGEIGIEFSKVVEYVELFGYDLLTSIRTVALTTPSAMLKEFLEGVISTIESGGDIKDYLREKADSAMLNYELERQKYLENIATYSDVYTGILIAAPLFFIVALSLVSMLGGTIGGMDVNTLILIGGYFVIPLLNVAFLIFLEATQPSL